MKISFLLLGLSFTGGSLVLYKHAENLTGMGNEVYIILPDRNFKWEIGFYEKIKNTHLQDSFKEKLIRICRKYEKKIFNEYFFKKYLQYLERKQNKGYFLRIDKITSSLMDHWVESDITIATLWHSVYAAAFISLKSKVIFYMQHYEELFYNRKNFKERILSRITYGFPIHLIANCTWLSNQIQNRFGIKPYIVNPAIVRPDLYQSSIDEIEKKFINYSQIYIISYCETARPFKGWKYAVEAMNIVISKYPNVIWRTFGGSTYVKDLSVKNYGKVSDETLADLYKSSHIGFLSSLYESFPLQPLEMMACGCATVTTPFGTEDYTDDKKNCLIVTPKNSQDLANKIIYLIEHKNDAKNLAIEGLKVGKKFNWDESTNKLMEIINEIKNSENKFADLDTLLPE